MKAVLRLTLAAIAGFAAVLLFAGARAEGFSPSGLLDVELRPLHASDSGMRSLRGRGPALIVVLDPRCAHCRAMRDEWAMMFSGAPERVARHLIFATPDTSGYQNLIQRSGARTSWVTPRDLSHHAGITAIPVTVLLNVDGKATQAVHGTFDASTRESFVRHMATYR